MGSLTLYLKMLRLFILSFLYAGCHCSPSKGPAPPLFLIPESGPPLLLTQPEEAPPLLLSEPESAPPLLLSEPESAPPLLLSEPESAPPLLLSEPESAPPLLLPEPESAPPILISEPETAPPMLILPPEPVPPLLLPGGESEPIVSTPEVSEYQESFVNNQVPLAEGGEMLAEITPPDNTTVVTFTVKMYYTQEFEDNTPEIEGFFVQIIDDTNQGFVNSEIPLRVEMLCSEKIGITETGSAQGMLGTFSAFGSTTLKDTADAAALFVVNSDFCNQGYNNALASGWTISIVKKSCAESIHSFAHNIGLHVGALPNREEVTSVINTWPYSYSYGYHIPKGIAATGARTIMAYSATGYETRVNYWSNPSVIFPITQTPTGVAGSENNAALLTLRRYTLAAVGDESSTTCKSTVTTAPVNPVTTAPVNPVTTAPVNPVTTAPVNPVTTAPVNPVTTAPVNPVTTAPLNPVTTAPVNPVTTAPVNPVTTAPLNPVTTMPIIPPVTAMPVNPSTACIRHNKRVVLKTIRRIKRVMTGKACAAVCKKNKKRCQYWMWTRKAKSCALMSVQFAKKKGVASGGLDC